MAAGKGVDLAVVFGAGGGGGRKKPPMSPPSKAMPMAEEADPMAEPEEEIDPAFEAAAVEYDPSLEGDTARLGAFKRAVMACMGSY